MPHFRGRKANRMGHCVRARARSFAMPGDELSKLECDFWTVEQRRSPSTTNDYLPSRAFRFHVPLSAEFRFAFDAILCRLIT